jgi:lipopolysaccharide export system protein LptA
MRTNFLLGVSFALLLGALLPGEAAAQQLSGSCRLMDTFRSITTRQVAPGVSVTWISRPDLRCPNGLRIRADSAVVYDQSGRNELIGNVRFTNVDRDLRSNRADWYERDGRLEAQGNVLFIDLKGGGEIRGNELSYNEARGGRPDLITVRGGRPSALIGAETGAPSTPTTDPYRITANQLRFEGEQFFWADGEVEVFRADLDANSDSLAYDRTAGNLVLIGNAEVKRESVLAQGGFVNLEFAEDRLRALTARVGGRVETESYILTGHEVLITLGADDALEGLTATSGRDTDSGLETEASLEGDNLRLTGNRVEIEPAVGDRRTLRATGRARGEALGEGFGAAPVEDAPAPEEPEEGEDSASAEGLPDRDWIEGEEIVAFFELAPSPSGETPAQGEEDNWRLTRMESKGSAKALYRSAPEEGGEEEEVALDTTRRTFSISYIMADFIIIHLEAGEVSFLEADGNVQGLQLEPQRGEGR